MSRLDTYQKISDLLDVISPDLPYTDWFRVLSVCRAHLGNEALGLVTQWSKGSGKFTSDNEVKTIFYSSDLSYNNIGSLINIAKQYGSDIKGVDIDSYPVFSPLPLHDDMEAIDKVNFIYKNSKEIHFIGDHPYLKRKLINPTKNIRLYRGNLLVIPLYNTWGDIVNVQFIDDKGNKRFKKGAKLVNHFHCLGEPLREPIIICEGYATGASLYCELFYKATVYIAFAKSNLINVATKLLQYRKDITIMGDNDGEHSLPYLSKHFDPFDIPYCIPEKIGDYNDFKNYISRDFERTRTASNAK